MGADTHVLHANRTLWLKGNSIREVPAGVFNSTRLRYARIWRWGDAGVRGVSVGADTHVLHANRDIVLYDNSISELSAEAFSSLPGL